MDSCSDHHVFAFAEGDFCFDSGFVSYYTYHPGGEGYGTRTEIEIEDQGISFSVWEEDSCLSYHGLSCHEERNWVNDVVYAKVEVCQMGIFSLHVEEVSEKHDVVVLLMVSAFLVDHRVNVNVSGEEVFEKVNVRTAY